MKTPKGLTIENINNKELIIIADNYDENLMLMQLLLLLLPLSIIDIVFIINFPIALIFTIPITAISGYYFIYNIKDKTKIEITTDTLVVSNIFNNKTTLNLKLIDIKSLELHRKSGKKLTSARTGLSSQTPSIDSLIIKTNTDDYILTNTLLYSQQVFIKKTIEEKLTLLQN